MDEIDPRVERGARALAVIWLLQQDCELTRELEDQHWPGWTVEAKAVIDAALSDQPPSGG